MKRLYIIFLLILPLTALACYKPIRILMPEFTDIHCLNKTLCIDTLHQAETATHLYNASIDYIESHIDSIQHKPRIIFCSSESCFNQFGFHSPAKGKTFATMGIVIGPEGWKDYIVRHELIHHLQVERMGLYNWLMSPQWFREGMAYAVSDDPRPLSENFITMRNRFKAWKLHQSKDNFWQAARSL